MQVGRRLTSSHGTVGRNMSLKNPVTPPGIDPGTVRLVAQRLNHYATPGPYIYIYIYIKLDNNIKDADSYCNKRLSVRSFRVTVEVLRVFSLKEKSLGTKQIVSSRSYVSFKLR